MTDSIRIFVFADDCALTDGSKTDMQDSVDKFSTACTNFGLTISTKKTEVLVSLSRRNRRLSLTAQTKARDCKV